MRDFTASPTLLAALCPAALAKLEALTTEFSTRAELATLAGVKAPALTRAKLDKGLIDSAGERFTPDEVYALPLLARVEHLTVRCSVTPGPWLKAAPKLKALKTLTLEAPTNFVYCFDLTPPRPRLTVRPTSYFSISGDQELDYLLVRPLASVDAEVRGEAALELPPDFELPRKTRAALASLGVKSKK